MIVSKKNLKFIAIGVLVFVAYKMYAKKSSPLAKADVPNSESESKDVKLQITQPYYSEKECNTKHMQWKKFSMTARFSSAEAMEQSKRRMLGECYSTYGQRK